MGFFRELTRIQFGFNHIHLQFIPSLICRGQARRNPDHIALPGQKVKVQSWGASFDLSLALNTPDEVTAVGRVRGEVKVDEGIAHIVYVLLGQITGNVLLKVAAEVAGIEQQVG